MKPPLDSTEKERNLPGALPEDSDSCPSPASPARGSRGELCHAILSDGGPCGLPKPCPIHKGPHRGNVAVVRLPHSVAEQIREMIQSGAFSDESEALVKVWEWYWEMMPAEGAKKFVRDCRDWEKKQP